MRARDLEERYQGAQDNDPETLTYVPAGTFFFNSVQPHSGAQFYRECPVRNVNYLQKWGVEILSLKCFTGIPTYWTNPFRVTEHFMLTKYGFKSGISDFLAVLRHDDSDNNNF